MTAREALQALRTELLEAASKAIELPETYAGTDYAKAFLWDGDDYRDFGNPRYQGRQENRVYLLLELDKKIEALA